MPYEKIYDYKDFISKLELSGLYTEELRNFIDDYMRWDNRDNYMKMGEDE